MKTKQISLILITATLASCGGTVQKEPPKNDTIYSNGHMIVTPHILTNSNTSEDKGVSRGGFGETGEAHAGGEGNGGAGE
jgi:hypothetical protein